jgi:integrase
LTVTITLRHAAEEQPASPLLEAPPWDAKLSHRKFRALRHTHTSLLLQGGAPPARVAAEAGRSLEETMRTYAHSMPGGNRAEAEVLAGLLSGKDSLSLTRSISGN